MTSYKKVKEQDKRLFFSRSIDPIRRLDSAAKGIINEFGGSERLEIRIKYECFGNGLQERITLEVAVCERSRHEFG